MCMSFLNRDEKLASIWMWEYRRVSGTFCFVIVGRGLFTQTGSRRSVQPPDLRFTAFTLSSQSKRTGHILCVVTSSPGHVLYFSFVFNKGLFWTLNQLIFEVKFYMCRQNFYRFRRQEPNSSDPNTSLFTSAIYWPIKRSTEQSNKDTEPRSTF